MVFMASFLQLCRSTGLPRAGVFLACFFATVHAPGSPTPTPTPGSSHLANISTRVNVGVADDVLIGGFIVRGPDTKKVILRAIGPSLTGAGVIGAMADPILELHDSTGATIATNDNWQSSAQASEIRASGLAPTNPLESAILATLQPGSYTAIVRGVNNTTGIALVECYEIDSAVTRLVNVSTRGRVGVGDELLIGGFIVTGSDSKRVIVRALGPSLGTGAHTLTGVLANPALELRDASGNLLSSNDNWENSPEHAAIAASGLAPPNSLESAILATLSPGNYTALVHGVHDTTGIALVEAYDLDPVSTREVWVAVRTDGQAGSGTESDPYDGSTMDKFDAIMGDNSKTPAYTIIHLGPGRFRTAASDKNNKWKVKSGWVVEGAGMYSTIVQMGGSVAGIHYDLEAFKSVENGSSTDNVTIRDFTVDCNWAELSATADPGLGGEKNIKVFAIYLAGSDNLIERVRHIHTYGSWANGQEDFGIFLTAPSTMDATGDRITYCRAELPEGNYGSAFNISGEVSYSPIRYVIDSKVDHCTVIGLDNGQPGQPVGFTIGLGGAAFVKNFETSDNFATDVAGVFYSDTGTLENIQILNNTVVRGWLGIGVVADGPNESWTKKNIVIRGNSINVQNRSGSAPSDAIRILGAPTTTCTIDSNTITFDMGGSGFQGFHTILAQVVTDLTISNNVVGVPAPPGYTDVTIRNCTNVTISGNHSLSGGHVPGL
jgi:hypothetical protein